MRKLGRILVRQKTFQYRFWQQELMLITCCNMHMPSHGDYTDWIIGWCQLNLHTSERIKQMELAWKQLPLSKSISSSGGRTRGWATLTISPTNSQSRHQPSLHTCDHIITQPIWAVTAHYISRFRDWNVELCKTDLTMIPLEKSWIRAYFLNKIVH